MEAYFLPALIDIRSPFCIPTSADEHMIPGHHHTPVKAEAPEGGLKIGRLESQSQWRRAVFFTQSKHPSIDQSTESECVFKYRPIPLPSLKNPVGKKSDRNPENERLTSECVPLDTGPSPCPH